ncbi:hypothetical protein DUI87_22801 [Hirundo rustica rustica]|uniref:Uncharacterized protein n=1 Tax=Hirundo rustica rustica TaxID=333673 RepID=A0A3M0JH65_HIRRU|nr:hypothetical protein DUI87_22801 [Hirundo rustica rustica]
MILQLSKRLQLSLMGLLPEKDVETFSITCGTISHDEKDDWRVSWKGQGLFHELTPCMFWEQTENFTWKSCRSSANIEDGPRDLAGKKGQDKAYTMAFSVSAVKKKMASL